MKKTLFVISKYNDNRQKIFDEIISPRNKQYCEKHNFKYVEIKNETPLALIRNNPIWWKFFIIKDLVDKNKLNDGDIITALDADMYIVDIESKLYTNKSFTYSIDSGNTHCLGWYSLTINEWSKQLINNIVDEKRYIKLINKQTLHPRFNTYSSLWQIWAEQASWYSLAGIKRHSDISFWNLDNNGFNSEITEDVIYSIDELKQNVEILKTEFNVTEWEGESSCEFNINNNVKRENVIIRHFAGGQDWNNIYNWIT